MTKSETLRHPLRRMLFLAVLAASAAAPASAQAPDWSVTPAQFEFSMQVVGMLLVDGEASVDPNDRVAVFAGDAVRGVAALQLVDRTGLFFLTVYANENGETLTFRAYDASADAVLDLAPALTFETNASAGTVRQPLIWVDEQSAGGQAPAWTVDPASFESSMQLVGTLLVDGAASFHPGDRVAAFAGDAVRGVAAPQFLNGQPLYFMTIYGSSGVDETLSFRVYSAQDDLVRQEGSTLAFASDAVVGSVAVPYTWAVDQNSPVYNDPDDPNNPTDPQDPDDPPGGISERDLLLPCYPNPFHQSTRIDFGLKASGPVRLTVVDLLGREVARPVDGILGAGWHHVDFVADELPDGIYLYHLKTASYTTSQMMIHLK